MQDADLLVQLAGIAGVFVGFGALISVRSGGPSEVDEVSTIRWVMSLGIWVIIAALTPVIVNRYDKAGHELWLVCGLLALVLFAVMLAVNGRAPETRAGRAAALAATPRARAMMVVEALEPPARGRGDRSSRVSDVDFERSIIRFRRAKGAKTLMITLHPDARSALATYLAEGRPALAGTGADRGFLFPAQRGAGAPLGMNALSLMLTRRYHAGGGSLPYFGSHRIRHATATFLVNNGMPFEEVSRYLGHSSTDVTRRYARHTPETLGAQAADALARAGVSAG